VREKTSVRVRKISCACEKTEPCAKKEVVIVTFFIIQLDQFNQSLLFIIMSSSEINAPTNETTTQAAPVKPTPVEVQKQWFEDTKTLQCMQIIVNTEGNALRKIRKLTEQKLDTVDALKEEVKAARKFVSTAIAFYKQKHLLADAELKYNEALDEVSFDMCKYIKPEAVEQYTAELMVYEAAAKQHRAKKRKVETQPAVNDEQEASEGTDPSTNDATTPTSSIQDAPTEISEDIILE